MVHPLRDQQSIVWIASYPRSGNTYVRLLLANYFIARFNPVSLHTLKDFNFGEHIEPLWLKVTGRSLAERDEPMQWKARAAYFDILRQTTPATAIRFVKTHTVNCMRWGTPAFNFRPNDRIIYIARDPRDVAVSLAAFHGWEVEQAVSHMLEPFASLSGHPNTGYEVTASWNLHVQTWTQTTECPVMVIPYSQLVADPETFLTKMLRFLDSPPNPNHVKNVITWAQFENLKKQETEGGFPEAPQGENRSPFFRAGKVGQWQNVLTDGQAARIDNASDTAVDLIRRAKQAHNAACTMP